MKLKGGNIQPKISLPESGIGNLEVEIKDSSINKIKIKSPENGQPFKYGLQIGTNLVPMEGVYWKFGSGVEVFVGAGTLDGCSMHHRAELKIPLQNGDRSQMSNNGTSEPSEHLPIEWVKDWLGCDAGVSLEGLSFKCEGTINTCNGGGHNNTPGGGIRIEDGALLLTGAAAMASLVVLAPEVGTILASGMLIQAAH